jgi:S1-C subfamily serine protease
MKKLNGYFLILLSLSLLGCGGGISSYVLDLGAHSVTVGESFPSEKFFSVGEIRGHHGYSGHCVESGGWRGNFDGALIYLKNNAAANKIDYVQIIKVIEPYSESYYCTRGKYTIVGVGYQYDENMWRDLVKATRQFTSRYKAVDVPIDIKHQPAVVYKSKGRIQKGDSFTVYGEVSEGSQSWLKLKNGWIEGKYAQEIGDTDEREITSTKIPQPKKIAPTQKPSKKTGTGFLIGQYRYVITNYHVVKETSSILVRFTNGQAMEANLVARDSRNDIAILKLATTPPVLAIPIKMGNSSSTRMGDEIFTIGYPASDIMGERPKYSQGVINAVTGMMDDPTFFQISVPIQPGNSGGPLFNEQGEVIGITTASLSLWAADAMGAIPQNVNYAIKSSFVKNLLSTIPELMTANKGIVVSPRNPENSLSNFVEQVSKNIVLIEARSN